MLDNILKAIKKNNVLIYSINEKNIESVELFFIKKTLTMRRQTNVKEYFVTIYNEFVKDDKKMLGESSVSISNGMTDEELDQKIKEAYFAASFVCNPYYELPTGSKEEKKLSKSDMASIPLSESAKIMTEALFAADNREDVFLNSAEMFIEKKNIHIVNSNGVDVSYEEYKVNGEFVGQKIEPTDVEIYHDFSFDKLDVDSLKKEVEETLRNTALRSEAKRELKSGTYKVVLPGKAVRNVFKFYADRGSASLIYSKYSDYEVGKNVQGDAKGDKITIELKAKSPYSSEGIKMIDRTYMEDGVVKCIHGDNQYCYYLGTEATGMYLDIEAKSGSSSYEALKGQTYLEVLIFSDFIIDTMTGHFAGEIRLGLFHEGDKVTPITGGSINGSLLESQENIRFSQERQSFSRFEGPVFAEFEKVSVAGAN